MMHAGNEEKLVEHVEKRVKKGQKGTSENLSSSEMSEYLSNLDSENELKGREFKTIKEGTSQAEKIENREEMTIIVNGIGNTEQGNVPSYLQNFSEEIVKNGVEDVREYPIFMDNASYAVGAVIGIGKVALEMANVDIHSGDVSDQIKKDLKETPLEEGEQLNLVGYSGGGQVVINAAENLEGTVRVDNIVTIGSPILECNLKNVDKITKITSSEDELSGWGMISGEKVETVEMTSPGHGDYFKDLYLDETVRVVDEIID